MKIISISAGHGKHRVHFSSEDGYLIQKGITTHPRGDITVFRVHKGEELKAEIEAGTGVITIYE